MNRRLPPTSCRTRSVTSQRSRTLFRRTTVFLFTDLVDSTDLWEQDEMAALGVLAEHDRIVRNLAAAFGGRVVKHTGDGMMVVFGRVSDAVEVGRLVTSLIASSPNPSMLPVRVGIHAGTAIQRGDDYFGASVCRAARVAAEAGPNEVLITEAALADDPVVKVSAVDHGSHPVKGVAEPLHLYRIEV